MRGVKSIHVVIPMRAGSMMRDCVVQITPLRGMSSVSSYIKQNRHSTITACIGFGARLAQSVERETLTRVHTSQGCGFDPRIGLFLYYPFYDWTRSFFALAIRDSVTQGSFFWALCCQPPGCLLSILMSGTPSLRDWIMETRAARCWESACPCGQASDYPWA